MHAIVKGQSYRLGAAFNLTHHKIDIVYWGQWNFQNEKYLFVFPSDFCSTPLILPSSYHKLGVSSLLP